MTIKFPNPFNFSNTPSTPVTTSYPSISIASNTWSNINSVDTGDFIWNNDYVGDSKWSININHNPDLNVEGDIKMKGRSLTEVLDKIEERLAILKPNPDLEERWEELRELGEKYRALEKELLEKEAMWKILNK